MEIQLILPLTKSLLIETSEGSYELRGDGNYYLTGTDDLAPNPDDIVSAISTMEKSEKSDFNHRSMPYFKTHNAQTIDKEIQKLENKSLTDKLEKLRTEAPTYEDPFFPDQRLDYKPIEMDRKDLVKILKEYFSIRGFSISMLENIPEDIKFTVTVTSKVEGRIS